MTEQTPTQPEGPTRRRRLKPGIAVAVGFLTVAGAVTAVGAVTANAEDDPGFVSLTAPAVADTEPDGSDPDGSDPEGSDSDGIPELDHDDFEDLFREFETCIDGVLDGLDAGSGPADLDFDALEEAFEGAEEACADLLPDGTMFEGGIFESGPLAGVTELAGAIPFDEIPFDLESFDLEAFDEFGTCIDDQIGGVLSSSTVFVEGPDGPQILQFGDTNGEVTISGTAGDLTIESSGGVTVLDEAALQDLWDSKDEVFEACEALLPTDVFGGSPDEGD